MSEHDVIKDGMKETESRFSKEIIEFLKPYPGLEISIAVCSRDGRKGRKFTGLKIEGSYKI